MTCGNAGPLQGRGKSSIAQGVFAGEAPVMHLNADRMHIPGAEGMSMGYFSYLYPTFLSVWQVCELMGCEQTSRQDSRLSKAKKTPVDFSS